MTSTATRTPTDMFDAFVNGRLTKPEWTHEAHLITCWVALQDRTPGQTLAFLRDAIQAHNCGIAIRNTEKSALLRNAVGDGSSPVLASSEASETSGYHETLTRYYVTAVADSMRADPSLEHVLDDPQCGRDAWNAHWSRDRMFSVDARLGWLPPDLDETPWPIVGDEG